MRSATAPAAPAAPAAGAAPVTPCEVCGHQYDVMGLCPCVYARDRCTLRYHAQHTPARFHQFEEPH